MNIALIGYGKMGREVERLALESGDRVVGRFDIDPPASVDGLQTADVCIEFSTPEAVLDNMKLAAEARVNIVVGTTGWYDHLPEVRGWFRDSAMIYAQNFSLGVNVFYRILRRAAQLMEAQPQYDVFIEEQHHKGKVDSPSGTALRLGEILLEEITRKTSIHKGVSSGPIAANDLQIASIRVGAIPGSHTVGFDSDADTIELHHVAKNRTGFAIGALEAARWIEGRQGVFTMDDVDL